MLTLRQIEVIRAIMVAGTVNGAAELLGVSAPGVSRVMKHAEGMLGIRLFSRRHGRFTPTPEARDIFGQINEVHRKVEDLGFAVDRLKRGDSSVFSFATVPSISQSILPRSVRRMRDKFPGLQMRIDTVKIEEAVDYLLLKKGELAALSYKLDHAGLLFRPLATGTLIAVVPEGHVLAQRSEVSMKELAAYPLIGFDPQDPYGNVLAKAFVDNAIPIDLSIQVRFAHTVFGMVRQNLGVAVIDEFSAAERTLPGIVRLPIVEPTTFTAYAAVNAELPETIFAEEMIRLLSEEMRQAVASRPWE
ncbi:MAG: LysR family transcriptional regulator [Alphaproteobacteria bacterium]|nr:LysR family transcriptional regulator [Alphaproteobacteria bacterium]